MADPGLRFGRSVLVVATFCFAAGGVAGDQEAATRGRPIAVAQALVDAFNRHDPAAMARLVSKDFELYYVDENGSSARALQGPEALEREMTGYFESLPDVRSKIVDSVDGPIFVSFREQIVGGRSSLAVYEVRDGRIRRVWYFPAESGP